MSNPLARDFEVLPHLRGYPDELHRYSNLIKQTHPRGTSAVEFLLGRAGAQDGFLETICRMVKQGQAPLSAVEAADLVGIAPQAFLETVASRPDFPPPVFRHEHRAVWKRADVEQYLRGASSSQFPHSTGSG